MISAIILRRIRFSDTSLIVTWFSDRHGKLKTIAKGGLRPTSPLAGKLDLFFHCDLSLAWARRSDLHTLREAVLREAFNEIRTEYVKMLAASYFAALVEEVTEPEHAVPEIYELLLRSFRYLQNHSLDLRGLTFFEFELCRILGVAADDRSRSAQQLLEIFGRLPDSRRELVARL